MSEEQQLKLVGYVSHKTSHKHITCLICECPCASWPSLKAHIIAQHGEAALPPHMVNEKTTKKAAAKKKVSQNSQKNQMAATVKIQDGELVVMETPEHAQIEQPFQQVLVEPKPEVNGLAGSVVKLPPPVVDLGEVGDYVGNGYNHNGYSTNMLQVGDAVKTSTSVEDTVALLAQNMTSSSVLKQSGLTPVLAPQTIVLPTNKAAKTTHVIANQTPPKLPLDNPVPLNSVIQPQPAPPAAHQRHQPPPPSMQPPAAHNHPLLASEIAQSLIATASGATLATSGLPTSGLSTSDLTTSGLTTSGLTISGLKKSTPSAQLYTYDINATASLSSSAEVLNVIGLDVSRESSQGAIGGVPAVAGMIVNPPQQSQDAHHVLVEHSTQPVYQHQLYSTFSETKNATK